MNSFFLNKQSKYILFNLLIGTFIISFLVFYAVNFIRNAADKSYSDFAQMFTKSIASQMSELHNLYPDSRKTAIKSKFDNLLNQNDDIFSLEYKDNAGNRVYVQKEGISENFMSVSSPIFYNDKIDGAVTISLSGRNIIPLSKTINLSVWGIFILTWAFFVILLLSYMLFISKEFKQLFVGVKQITHGKFGYNVQSNNISGLSEAFNYMSDILSKYNQLNVEQITLERNKLEAVLMSIINGVIVCDNYDNVVLANSAALKILDIDEKNFLNTKIQDYVDSHGQKCFLQKIEEFKETPINIIEQKPVELNIEAGKLTVKAMISPMFSKQQDYVGYIIVLIDITRETEVNKLKNTFISNVSHELRTPVTVLRTYIDTLCNNSEDFDEETKKEFMQTIDTEAKRLHSMVNDILDFSRLESGNVSLKKEYANLPELLEQNINSIKILADEKNINIALKKEGEIPLVPLNIESIDRVIRNLLSNAIKYSLEGKDIEVVVKLSDDKQYAQFSVKDNGIGIAKEHLDKIFDRFYRVENATHSIKGTGLGLHLVKMTVEKHHNGKITVTSKENEGSVFTVFLPLNIDESELV